MAFLSPNYRHHRQSGQSLIELLIVMALAAILLPALMAGLILSRQGRPQTTQRAAAAGLLREAEESVRSLRSKGWSFVSTNPLFHTYVSGSSWASASGSETINGYTRSISITDVLRDSTGKIVFSGGIVDPSTKLVAVTVSWSTPYPSSVSTIFYLTRYRDNLAWIQTTVADFTGVAGNMSNLQGTTITNTSGGEIVLGQGNANWCRPQDYVLSTYTLPRQGNAIVATAGPTSGSPTSAYVGMGDGSSGMTYQTLSISDPPSPAPPVVSPVGTGYSSSYKTNAVANDGTYTYLATNGTSNQVVILDSSYAVKGTISLPSNTDANGIFVQSGLAYITSSNKMYVYNVTNPASPQLKGTATLWNSGATAKQVVYQAGKAYVSMSGSITGLELFTVSGGGTIIVPWSIASVTWFQTPVGLAINSTGTRAYIAFTASGSIKGGFFIIDTSTRWFGFYNPNKATYNTNWDGNGTTNPLGMTIATANKAILVGTGGSQQYQVVDIANDSPAHCGGLSISQGVSAVTSVIQQDGRVFAYAISGEANNQFKIVEGGTGGRYTNTGTFESTILDANYSTAFNRFSATINQPPQTSIQLQVAAAPPVGSSCTGALFNYVGPNGIGGASPSAYFAPSGNTISGTVPFGQHDGYQNPNRCFRYKVYLSTNDTSQTPALYDMNVNYSP